MTLIKRFFPLCLLLALLVPGLALYGWLDRKSLQDRCAGLALAALHRAGDTLAARELGAAADHLARANADLARAKELRAGLAAERDKLRRHRRAVNKRFEENRGVLEQIHEALKQDSPDGSVQVGGQRYPRQAVECDAEQYLWRCRADEAELARLNAAADELASAVAEADRYIEAAEALAQQRQGDLVVQASRAEAERLRRELALLGQGARWESWTRLLRAAPTADRRRPRAPATEGGRSPSSFSPEEHPHGRR
jgi:hypothetical protein